jgi:hypothetical protein
MEKSSGAAAGGSAPPSPFQMEDFQLEGKRPVKNPFVPIGTYAPPSLWHTRPLSHWWTERSRFSLPCSGSKIAVL